jgi:DNA-binding transcriptional LysR family regulator
MRLPTLHGMRAFRAVVELKSFKRAGERLGLGGSAVSKLVAGLEHDLDALLLQRTTRTLALTEAGTSFYESVVLVLDEIERSLDQLHDRHGQPQGLLRVSLPTSFALRWLSSRIPDFLVRYPNLRVDLALNDRFVDLVAERFDCALRIGTALPDSSLYARRLGSMPRVLVAAPRYLKGAPPLHAPADLVAHQALLYSLASTGSAWPFVVDGRPVSVEVTGRLMVDNSVILRDALVAGLGLALTPHFVVQDLLASRKLVALLPGFMAAAHGVYGVVSQRRHLPLKTRVFLDFVATALQACGYSDRAASASASAT